MNTGCCPETSRDANGYNRQDRIKVCLKQLILASQESTSFSAKSRTRSRCSMRYIEYYIKYTGQTVDASGSCGSRF